MQSVLQSKERRRHRFARALEPDDRFLLALACEDEQVTGLGAIELRQQFARLR